MHNTRPAWKPIAVFATVFIAAILLAWTHLRQPANGPQPVHWNRDLCAQCGMIVGDRHFAAQAQLADGETLNFDDPGCLMTWLQQHRTQPRALYFRRLHGHGWLPLSQAAFVRVAQSPSGFDLGAVPPGTPGAMPWRQALALARQMEHRSMMEAPHVR